MRFDKKYTGHGWERYRSLTMRFCPESGHVDTINLEVKLEKQAKFSEEFGIRGPLVIFKIWSGSNLLGKQQKLVVWRNN